MIVVLEAQTKKRLLMARPHFGLLSVILNHIPPHPSQEKRFYWYKIDFFRIHGLRVWRLVEGGGQKRLF